MSTATREFSVNQLALIGYRRAGLMNANQTPAETLLSAARDELDLMLDALPTEGVFARAVKFFDLALTAQTYRYTLQDTHLNVIGDGAYIAAGTADLTKASGETPIKMIDRAQWQGLSAKDATGIPTLFYPHRITHPFQIYLWPIPEEAGTARLQVHSLSADNTDGNATTDLQREWHDWIGWELAFRLATSNSLAIGHRQELERKAQEKLMKAKGLANQRPDVQLVLQHSGGYRRRR